MIYLKVKIKFIVCKTFTILKLSHQHPAMVKFYSIINLLHFVSKYSNVIKAEK